MALHQMTKKLTALGKSMAEEGLKFQASKIYQTCLETLIDSFYCDGEETVNSKKIDKKTKIGIDFCEQKLYDEGIESFKRAIDLVMKDIDEWSKVQIQEDKHSSHTETDKNVESSPKSENEGKSENLPKPFVPRSPINYTHVCGLDEGKQILDQMFLLPIEYSEFYHREGIIKRTVLFYGPPGTGKTRLAVAVAGEYAVPIFMITPASLLSKWKGQTEQGVGKFVKAAIQAAKTSKTGFSIIMVDECDAFFHRRREDDSDALTSNQLLMAIDGADYTPEIIWIALTNLPQSIDSGFISRFSVKVYIPLPNFETRKEIIERGLQDMKFNVKEPLLNDLAKGANRFSCRELNRYLDLCDQIRVEKMLSATHWKKVKVSNREGYIISTPEEPGSVARKLKDMHQSEILGVDVYKADILRVMRKVKAATEDVDIDKCEDFSQLHNSTGNPEISNVIVKRPYNVWDVITTLD